MSLSSLGKEYIATISWELGLLVELIEWMPSYGASYF